MMASLNARITAMAVFLALSVTTLSFAAGPTFVSPTDGAIVRGELVVQAEKRPVDGNNSGYVSYRITGQDISAPKADMAVAVIYPFEYSWDTQQTFVNAEDPWDPHNGSRRYPDGLYTITAVAFGQDGKQVGEATKITVTVANGIANPPRNADGRILLQPGGGPEQTVRYAATGELNARLTPVEVENLQHTERPAIAEMKMAAEWRNVVRKPFGPGHTADGKRWHGQRDEDYYRDPLRRAMVSTWRDVQYGVIDQYPEEGWVEMLGPALSD
ncbi:MAG: hypothetical protein KBI47_09380, partial [Armatimonadetes bacterium]|nr:hypothetical protein [Armatimonadota bacterium]